MCTHCKFVFLEGATFGGKKNHLNRYLMNKFLHRQGPLPICRIQFEINLINQIDH